LETFEARLERIQRPMEEREALRYAAEVLDILDYPEQQTPPIVHRDIKPANIIIGAKDQRAHLVDSGIARTYTPSTAQRKQTIALGTLGYPHKNNTREMLSRALTCMPWQRHCTIW
jgi:eukaryotic-like serine/threonine-protein kinase